MHFLFRLVASIVMLLALTRAALVLRKAPQYFSRDDRGAVYDCSDFSAADAGVVDRIERMARDVSPGASLFCLGAILYVLTRMSADQEQGKDLG